MPSPPADCQNCNRGLLGGGAEQYWEDHLRQPADRAADMPAVTKDLVNFAVGIDYTTDHEERAAYFQKQKVTELPLVTSEPTAAKDKPTPRFTAPPKPPPYPCSPNPSPAEAIAEAAKAVGCPVTPPTVPTAPDPQRMGPPGLEAAASLQGATPAAIPPPPPPNHKGIYLKERDEAKTTSDAVQAAKAAIADVALVVGPPRDMPKPAPPPPPQRDAHRKHERGGYRKKPDTTNYEGAKTKSSLPLPHEEPPASIGAETTTADAIMTDAAPNSQEEKPQCSSPADDAPTIGRNWCESPPKLPERCPAHFFVREQSEPQTATKHNLGANASCRCCTGKCAICVGMCLDLADDQWLVIQARKEDAKNASDAPAVRDPLCRGVIHHRLGDPTYKGVKEAVIKIQERQKLAQPRKDTKKTKTEEGKGDAASSCENESADPDSDAVEVKSKVREMGEGKGDAASSCETVTADPDLDSEWTIDELTAQLRKLRVAPDCAVRDPSTLRVCNCCGVAFFWKLTEQHWLSLDDLPENTWFLGTIWEK
ncbi:hypothetical protein N9L68_06260 [bacterium]|nr:hypothetical protein [bacterium]